MNNIKVLDCTLRDGGYCNKWNFGYDNIRKINSYLNAAQIDIIEIGYLSSKATCNKNTSIYSSLEEIEIILDTERKVKNCLYVCMINYGEYSIEDIPDYRTDCVLDGFRVAFHKKDMDEALKYCSLLQEKGYKVFIQPMVTISYSDEEILSIIKKVNVIKPFAAYIVDSFGVMTDRDLLRLFYLFDHNLDENIIIGYHAHNNMQLAFSNAKSIAEVSSCHDIILDASIFGMGRGAGNLNTELLIEYLNEQYMKKYEVKYLLSLIDDVIYHFYEKNRWGYSLPNYLSAKHNLHPNYANYLERKHTLTFREIDEIFCRIKDEKKIAYDEEYVESLYLEYQTMNTGYVDIDVFKSIVKDKEILIIAPGRSSLEESVLISKYAERHRENLIIISVNFDYEYLNSDYIFVSNIRRFSNIQDNKYNKCIVTSNIKNDKVNMKFRYCDLLNSMDLVKDNAVLMLIKLLILTDVKHVLLAGVDGYSSNIEKNFLKEDFCFSIDNKTLSLMNTNISIVLQEYSKGIDVKFLTKPKFIKL